MHKLYHASFAHKITVFKEQNQKKPEFHESYEWGEPNHRTPETDSPNPWGSIEPRLRTTVLRVRGMYIVCIASSAGREVFSKLSEDCVKMEGVDC